MRERHTARRRVDSSLRDQRTRLQINEASFQFLDPIGWVHRGTRRARRHGENRHGHLRTIRQHHYHPVMTAYSRGPQRAPRLVDVLIKAAVGKRSAPRSENRRRVRNTLGLMFQYVREARKGSGGSWVYGTFVWHGSRSQPTQNYGPPVRPGAEDFDGGPNTLSTSPQFVLSALLCSSQKPMSISRYIVVAVVRFSRAQSDLPVRR